MTAPPGNSSAGACASGARPGRWGVLSTTAAAQRMAVVGVFGDDIGANAAHGSTYVFTRSDTVWTQQQNLTAINGAAVDHFGRSVAISGDTVVAGAPNADIGAKAEQGSAYVFTRSF